MSTSSIVLIPVNPQFVPSEAAQSKAVVRLKKFVKSALEINVVSTERIRFIDCGGNYFVSVRCPSCSTELPLEIWHEWMNQDFQDQGFQLGMFLMPCCAAHHTLNELSWDAPCGFSRFSIEAVQPYIAKLTPEVKQELEELLETPLRAIDRRI